MREFEMVPVFVLVCICFLTRLAKVLGIMYDWLLCHVLDGVVSVFDVVNWRYVVQVGCQAPHDLMAGLALIIVIQLACIKSYGAKVWVHIKLRVRCQTYVVKTASLTVPLALYECPWAYLQCRCHVPLVGVHPVLCLDVDWVYAHCLRSWSAMVCQSRNGLHL